MKPPRIRNTIRALILFSILDLPSSTSIHASSGCSYPTTLDIWTDKIAGDFLTIADVNQFRCAIEKLESGPLRLSDGTQAAPAYSFLSDPDTGIWRSSANVLNITTGGLIAAQFNAAASAVNYLRLTGSPTGAGPELTSIGSDADISIVYNAKGGGVHGFYRSGIAITAIDAASRISRYVYKTAAESAVNATLQNDDQLVLSVEANSSYYVQAVLLAQIANAGSAPDLKVGWVGPAGASFIWGNLANTSFGNNLTISATANTGLPTAPGVFSFGGILTTAGTAGTIQLQWAQAATDAANSTTVQSSSFLTLTKLN